MLRLGGNPYYYDYIRFIFLEYKVLPLRLHFIFGYIFNLFPTREMAFIFRSTILNRGIATGASGIYSFTLWVVSGN